VRKLVTAQLARWGLDPLADRVALVVTELATNALNYGAPPRTVQLTAAGPVLQAAVFDAGPLFGPPAPPAAGEIAAGEIAAGEIAAGEIAEPGGWGLAVIVTEHADSWIVTPVDGGKAVVARWQVPPAAGTVARLDLAARPSRRWPPPAG
jgi:Histidine kinase-like ATPase domain